MKYEVGDVLINAPGIFRHIIININNVTGRITLFSCGNRGYRYVGSNPDQSEDGVPYTHNCDESDLDWLLTKYLDSWTKI
jgi:hypothetical protein